MVLLTPFTTTRSGTATGSATGSPRVSRMSSNNSVFSAVPRRTTGPASTARSAVGVSG